MPRKKKGEPELIGCQWAKKLKLKRYFTGQPCAKGHISERYTRDHACCQCKNEETLAAYHADPRRKEKQKAYALMQYHMKRAEAAAVAFAALKTSGVG